MLSCQITFIVAKFGSGWLNVKERPHCLGKRQMKKSSYVNSDVPLTCAAKKLHNFNLLILKKFYPNILLICIPFSQCHPVSVNVIQCQSVSFSVCQCHSVSVSVIQCQSMSSSVSQCHSVPFSVCQWVFLLFAYALWLLLSVAQWLVGKTCISIRLEM